MVIARIVSGGLGRKHIAELRSLAKGAKDIMKTDFAKKGKRSANGKKGARGKIIHVGHRNRDGVWEAYACKSGKEEAYQTLFQSAQRVTEAMAAADYRHNKAEQDRTGAAIEKFGSTPTGCRLGPLLNAKYFVGVFGFDAGNQLHTDPNDDGGGLFVQVGTGECMFALPEFEVYVRAKLGDVLYINTPRFLHGACVPPAAAEVKSVGQNRSHVSSFSASRKEHITYGVYCPSKVTTQCPGSVDKKRRPRRKRY